MAAYGTCRCGVAGLAAVVLCSSGPAARAGDTAALDTCEAAARGRPDDPDAYHCLWILARQGQADAVAERLDAWLATASSNPYARLVRARIEADRGGDTAETLYRAAAGELAARGDRRGEALARLGLAAFQLRRGRFADTEATLAEVEGLAKTTGDRELAARVLNQRGWLAHQKGDFAEAWRLFKQVEAAVVPGGPLDLQALCLSGLGAVAQETQQLHVSLDYIRRQADVSRRLGDSYDEARARGNLVITAFRLASIGEMDDAEIGPMAREALAAAVAGGNPGSVARARLYLGDLTSGLEAREHYRRGLELGREVASLTNIVLGLRGLALSLVESEPRDVDQAFRLIEDALAFARGSPYYFALMHAARARMRSITGPWERAVADSLAALDAAEAIRDRQDDGLARARVFSAWTFPYYRLAGHLLAGPGGSDADRETAFAVTERMRARVLLDELDAARATGALAPAGPLSVRRADVLKAIAAVQRRLQDPRLAGSARQADLAELDRLELAESALRAEMARADPAFGLLRAPRFATLAELRGLLAEDEALLSFLVASRRNPDNRTTRRGSWVWVVTRDGVRVHPLPDREDLRAPIDLFLGLLQRRDGSEARSARRLYDLLLASAVGGLPRATRRLVVIPDGPLHRLPFAALRADGAGPLVARYEISAAPSATLWARWRRVTSRPGRDALVLADPPQPLGSLAHARAEADAIVRRLGAAVVVVKAGPDASEALVKSSDLGRYGVVHLATHAVVDEERPERSHVLLDPGAAGEDGLLQIREAVSLRLGDPLVFLSACRSAGGPVVDGEGPLGLARAFFQAGARAVVGSLWPVRDDETRELVDRFYRHAADGRTVAAALAAAHRESLEAGRPAAAWAGLVVLGDGDLRLRTTGQPHRHVSGNAFWILAWLSAAALAFILLRRRRR